MMKNLSRVVMLAVFMTAPGIARSDREDGKKDAGREVVTPNQFPGTDVQRINRAVRAAAASSGRVVIPRWNVRGNQRRDVWLLDAAILLPSNITVELDNCHIKLSDRCRDNFIRSANCGLGITDIRPEQNICIRGIGHVVLEGADHPRATGDSGKTIGARTYGTDAGVADKSQNGDWRNVGILLAFVTHFRIENISIEDSHAWAISLERCAHGTLRDLDFASTSARTVDGVPQTILNQDGIDLRLGCHDILIENITGYTGDDLIALTAIPVKQSPAGSTTSMMVSNAADRGLGQDDIRQVIIRDVRGYSRGRCHIVRLLNTSGVALHDVLLDGLLDTSPDEVQCRAAVKIGDSHYGGGIAPLGDTYGIMIHHVMSKSTYTILVGGSLVDSIISDVIRYGASGEIVTVASGPQYVRDVTIANTRVMAP